jgi:hypothetical protein
VRERLRRVAKRDEPGGGNEPALVSGANDAGENLLGLDTAPGAIAPTETLRVTTADWRACSARRLNAEHIVMRGLGDGGPVSPSS